MEKRQIRLIALDLDGTLFSAGGRLSPYAGKILKTCREKGILIVICSGRPLYSIRREISAEYYDYAIAMNGQQIYTSEGREVFSHRNLSSDEIRELIRYTEKFNVMMSCSFDDRFHHYCSKKHHFAVVCFQSLKNIARCILGRKVWQDTLDSDYGKLPQYQIGKICYSGVPASLKKIADSLDERRYSSFLVNPGWLEVMPKGISKGAALKELISLCGIDKENTAAIGDGENDLSMLEEAGIAVAMKNAMPSLKQAADEITQQDHIHDGAAQWIESRILNLYNVNLC